MRDEALKELKGFKSAWPIEQNAYTTLFMEQGIVKRLDDLESKYLLQAISRAILQGYGQVVNVTNIRSTWTIQVDHLQASDAKKRLTEQSCFGNGKVVELK